METTNNNTRELMYRAATISDSTRQLLIARGKIEDACNIVYDELNKACADPNGASRMIEPFMKQYIAAQDELLELIKINISDNTGDLDNTEI